MGDARRPATRSPPGPRRPPPSRSTASSTRAYPYDDDGKRIVPIRVKLVGQLRGGRDWYPATGDRMLKIEVGRDGADARVANPGLVMWMRDVSFSMLYTPAEVYMVPDRNDPTPQVAPVPVFVPKGAEGDPDAPEIRVRRALELLLAGPQGPLRQPRHGHPARDQAARVPVRQGRGNRQPLAQVHPARRLRAAPGRPGRLDGEPPAPDRVGPAPGRGPRGQDRGRRPVPDQPAVAAARTRRWPGCGRNAPRSTRATRSCSCGGARSSRSRRSPASSPGWSS